VVLPLCESGENVHFHKNSFQLFMKVIFLFSICALIAFTGCPPRQSGSSNDAGGSATSTKDQSTDGSASSSTDQTTDGSVSPTKDQPTGKKFTVSGTVLRTADYCGGAAPSEEMLEEMRTPKPFAGMKVHARKGGTNQIGTPVVASSTSDESGYFSLELPAGTWCLVLDEKGPDAPRDLSGQNIQLDNACYKEWLSKCDQVIEVIDVPIPAVKLQFNARCRVGTISNCAQWVGPLPPSAAPRER
jgi:hypothetical protein